MNLKLKVDNTAPSGDRHRMWMWGNRVRGGSSLKLIEHEGKRYWGASTDGISYDDEYHSPRYDCKTLLRRHAERLENLARTIEVLEERLKAEKPLLKLIKVDEVTWDGLDVDVRIARFLHNEITAFRADNYGTPQDYFPDPVAETSQDKTVTAAAHQAYLADLDKICASFRFAGWSESYLDEEPEGYQEGLDLFAKLFSSLWH